MKNTNDLKRFSAPFFGAAIVAGKGGSESNFIKGSGGYMGPDGTAYTPGINPGGSSQYGPQTGINPYPYQTGGKGAFTKSLQVIDKDGNPLVGAHLTWKMGGTTIGTTTDGNGEATVNVDSESTQVSISYMGKRGHVASFANLGSLITLQDNVNSLPPVVVGQKPTTTTTLPPAKKTNLVKTAAIGIGALLLISALGGSSKKSKGSGLNGTKGKKRKSGKKGKKRNGLREPAEITL